MRLCLCVPGETSLAWLHEDGEKMNFLRVSGFVALFLGIIMHYQELASGRASDEWKYTKLPYN